MMHVALLRGVNVGGNNLIAMADLCGLLEKLKLSRGRSLLQSGNLIFEAEGRGAGELERMLETETEKRFKLRIDYFVRTADEWKRIVARNPFPGEAKDDPSHLLVQFLKRAPESKDAKELEAWTGPERIRTDGKQAYVTYPAGIGRSKLTPPTLQKKLGSGTGRNWNTILKLSERL
jgi:uncharacterized protein (DUF1697 family)